MNRFILPLLIFAITGLVLSAIGMFLVLRGGSSGETVQRIGLVQDPVAVGLSIPEFSLTDQGGRPRTHEMLEGRVTILDFMFTHCPFACPGMTMAMTDVARRLEGTGVQFLSISVDPLRDTPERLTKYAADHNIDTARWTFLTGDMATIKHIAGESLKFLVQPDERVKIDLPDGTKMANIMHPTKFILVGPDRRVLGFYESGFPEDLDALTVRARAAAASLRR